MKRNYKITPEKMSFGTTFKVEIWDEYGNKRTVYERNVMDASKEIYNFWKSTEERMENCKLLDKAIQLCNEIDKESGILTGNCDSLD